MENRLDLIENEYDNVLKIRAMLETLIVANTSKDSIVIHQEDYFRVLANFSCNLCEELEKLANEREV